MTDQQRNAIKWTVWRCGLAGVAVVGMMSCANLVRAIPQVWRGNWTWDELAVFPLQVIVLGFLTGATLGLFLPLARRGRWGDAITGAACANIFLLICFAMFETDALLNPRLESVLAFTFLATVFGLCMGLVIRNDLRSSDSAHGLDKALVGQDSFSNSCRI